MARGRTQPASLIIREARMADLPRVVEMLADDKLGAEREWVSDPLRDSYYDAFASIDSDRNNQVVVAEQEGKLVGTLQLTFIPCLTYQGGWRALIESMRVDSEVRGEGLGKKLVTWAIDAARERHCHLVQLTTDKQREDARLFYEGLGFVASHEGMKLRL